MGTVGAFQGDFAASVENEWLCSRIAREFGLAVADCDMAQFEDQKVLIVERFDRKLSHDGKWWLRLPQENMCQALASPIGIKYESDGAPDGHARNFSVFIERGGTFSLTPLYDVLSAYPLLGRGKNKLAKEKVKLAMAVRGRSKHYHWDRIARKHWIDAAGGDGIGTQVETTLGDLAGRADAVADKVSAALPKGFPASVADPILEGMRKAAKRLRES